MYDIVEYKRIEESALKIQDERRTEMGILIRGGRIVDAATDTDKTGDIYLEDGIIAEIGQKLKKKDGEERQAIETAILQNNGNLTAAAEQLGISRQTLYNKLKRFKP